MPQDFAASLASWVVYKTATLSELQGDLLWMAIVFTVTPPTVLQNVTAEQWDMKSQTCYLVLGKILR